MSDSSAPHAVSARLLAPAAPAGAALLRSLAPLLGEWLPHQRWFAGSQGPVSGLSLVAATELLPCATAARPTTTGVPGLLHLLVRAPQSGGRPDDCYQLLLGVRPAVPAHLARSLIGHPDEGPLRGQAVYEALHDPRLAAVLLERLAEPGRLGALRFARESDAAIPTGLRPRLLAVEQSNTSVVYGDRYILKIFRRVSPGSHPDLELPLALARAGCPRVPPPVAWFEAALPGAVTVPLTTPGWPEAARAQGPSDVTRPVRTAVPAVRGAPPSGERWWAAEHLAPGDAHPRSVAPPSSSSPRSAAPVTLGVVQPFLPDASDGWRLALGSLAAHRDFTGASRELGQATAEVHTALARALPTVQLRRRQLERLAAAMTERLEAAAVVVPALRPYRCALRAAYQALAELGRRGRTWSAQRVHGDLHLGQVLRSHTDGRWTLIDFEGEPARALAERRDPQPVLRDVAGILRSFDYAACQRWAEGERMPGWARANRAAFCRGYAEAAGADPRDDPELLRAFETDKAVYEVVYEAQHRPSWVAVPLSAIRRLAANPSDPA